VSQKSPGQFFWLIAIAAISASGMLYELLVATISGYVLGDTVTNFSLVIGIFLCAMGIGAALSRNIHTDLVPTFLTVELWLAFVGLACGPVLLYFGFILEEVWLYLFMMVCMALALGILVGLEIPIVTRHIQSYTSSRVALANVLAADYAGALLGSVAFPFLLLPYLGLMGTAGLAALINLFVALACLYFQRTHLSSPVLPLIACLVLAGGSVSLIYAGEPLLMLYENRGYRDKIIHREQTRYQRIILTQGKKPPGSTPAPAGYMPRRWKD